MFSSGPNYTKLKTHLRLAINRLKLIEKKKTELTQKSRKEIADYISGGKAERAKIRVEHIIREDYLVEAMEIVEMYCDLVLARFGLVTQMKTLDEGIAEAISSIIWVAPRLQTDIQELKVIAELLTAKYGKPYADACRAEAVDTISEKLKHKLSIQSPPKLLVEKYVIEIAKNYNIQYEPDPQIMKDDRTSMGVDALLDLTDTNNLGGGGAPQPAGFIGFPMPPALPNMDQKSGYVPFNYPTMPPNNFPSGGSSGGFVSPIVSATAPNQPYGAFSYNIPPADDNKDLNINFGDDEMPPSYNSALSPDENLQNKGGPPKPQPRSKLDGGAYPDLPDLPSVPSDSPIGRSTSNSNQDIDFDDLARRFEELKKKK